jgi:hypothetical protein
MKQSSLSKWVSGVKEEPRAPVSREDSLILDWRNKEVLVGGDNGEEVGVVRVGGAQVSLRYAGTGDEREWENSGSQYKSVPMLKSLLQKSVRRMESDVAVRSARELILLDVGAFMRRLPIICIEDVAPIQGLDVSIWLMAAHSKGFVLLRDHVEYLLGFVGSLANYPKKIRKYQPAGTGNGADPGALRRCLELRRAFGGMKGDMKMLSILESHVEAGTMSLLQASIVPVDPDSTPPLGREDWIPEAVDFHVCSIAKKLATETGKEEGLVRRLMWNNSSSLNLRRKPRPEDPEWSELRPRHAEMACWWVKNVA